MTDAGRGAAVRIALGVGASLAPFALARWQGARFGDVALLGWIASAWIVVASWPGLPRQSLALVACSAWPCLALGAGVSARETDAAWVLAPAIAWSVVLTSVLARLASRSGGNYAVVWSALLLAPVLTAFALDYSVGVRATPRWLAVSEQASPLGWALSLGSALPSTSVFFPAGPCLVTALLACAAALDAKRAAP